MACEYKFEGKTFNSLKDLTKHLASLQFNEPTPATISQDEAVKALSSVGGKINFVDRKMVEGEMVEAHDYEFKGVDLKPVSNLIEEQYRFQGGPMSERGQRSNTEGTKFHNMAEDIINGLNEGKSIDSLLKGKSQMEQKWINEVHKMYEKWSDGGKNKVLTEFRIGNLKAGVAGTVDVAVVHPDGSVSLYDFKGTGSKYLKEEDAGIAKRRANNFQLNLYQRMLEVGDKDLGIPPMKVNGGGIIPIEFDITDDGHLKDFEVLTDLDYKDKKTFAYHNDNRALAKSMFPVEGSDTRMRQLQTSQIADWQGFLHTHTEHDFTNSAYESGATRMMEKSYKENGRYVVKYGSKKIEYKNPIAAYDEGAAGRQARYDELVNDYKELFAARRDAPAADFVHYLNFGKPINFQMDDKYDPNVARLRQFAHMYKPHVDRAFLAKNFKGLENMGDDTVVVLKGYNNLTGSYSSVDILTINADIDIKQAKPLAKGNTIAGKYLTNSQAKTAAQKAGKHGVQLWHNTRENVEMLKMGLVAMHLKQNNPNMKIDTLTNATMGYDNAPKALGRNMHEVMDQLEILASLKQDGKSILDLAYGRDTKVSEMLKDSKLTKAGNYTGNNLETYLRFVARVLTQDVTAGHNVRKHNKNIEKWTTLGDNKELLQGIFTDEGLDLTLKMIEQNDDLKGKMMNAIQMRMQDIQRVLNQNKQDRAKDDLEFQYLSKAWLELRGVSSDFSSFRDMNWVTRNLVTPGMSGIEMVDELIGQTQRTIGEMNRDIFENFFKESREMHQKLFKDMGVLDKRVKGTAADIYIPLMETIELEVKDQPGKKVKRQTGRFWSKDSAQYKRLSKTQQEYIEWYQRRVEEAMTQGMDEDQKKDFKEYWKDNFIPVIKPSADTLFGDMMSSQGSEGPFMDKLNAWWQRSLDPYASKNDYVENLSDGYEHIIDKFEVQKKFSGDADEVYGDMARMRRLGITADGKAESHYVKSTDISGKAQPLTRAIETNLEHVLAYAMMNQYRMRYLDKAVNDFEAMRSYIEHTNSKLYRDNTTVQEYMANWRDKNLFQKNQVTKEQEGLAKTFQATKKVVNAVMLDYNILSQSKNFIAGFYHTMSTGIANPKLGKNLPKAYAKVSNPQNASLVSSLMWGFGLANADSEQLVNGFYTQKGKRGFTSHHWKNFLNYHGDYFHRSVFMMANMEKDGVMEAYVKNPKKDGPDYIYDQDKDPRFKGEAGKSLFAAVYAQMEKDGQVDENGRMLRPYTSFEIQNMKTEANEAFEAQNPEDQANFANTVGGILFGQFRSWWYQKVKRYAMTGATMKSRKKFVTRLIKDPNTGKETYVTDTQSEYMEGIFQTVMGMTNSLKAAYDTKNPKEVKAYFQSMSEHQKSNVRRLLGDFAMLGGLIALGGLLFDDDDEDTLWYYLWYESAREINQIDHIMGTPVFGTGSAAPSIGFVHRVIENPVDAFSQPGAVKFFNRLLANQ